MILKVLQPDTRRWFYYDKVCLFKLKYGVCDLSEPVQTGDADTICLLPEDHDPKKPVAICDVNFESGRCLEITFDREGYLLNDVGKTIEKII